MVQCRKINSRDCRSNRFAVSAVAATVTATAVVLVLVAAAITATAIDTVIYIDRDKNRLGPNATSPPTAGGGNLFPIFPSCIGVWGRFLAGS